MTDDNMTPFEKDMMEKLPKERVPNRRLEERVVSALRAHGILEKHARASLAVTAMRAAAAVAVSLALLAGGFLLGRTTAPRLDGFRSIAADRQDDTPAVAVQQAGTAYIQALERFAATSNERPAQEVAQGREVALNTLYTAADQVTRVVPREYLAGQFLISLEVAERARLSAGDDDARPRAVRF